MAANLATLAAQHLDLAISALALALGAGVPLGVLAGQYGSLRGAVLAVTGVGRTLPSLAVLMLLVPLVGVGTLPAVIALALLAVPPIAIGVDLGIRKVPAAVLDAANGLGMTAVERFLRVVVPLALPVSFAGVRTAATETIASATLATFVGGGGLGDAIVRGLQTNDVALLLSGAATVAALALTVEVLFGTLARRFETLT